MLLYAVTSVKDTAWATGAPTLHGAGLKGIGSPSDAVGPGASRRTGFRPSRNTARSAAPAVCAEAALPVVGDRRPQASFVGKLSAVA